MKIEQLTPGFGSRIAGLDLSGACSPADVAALRHAFDEHHLLVFEGCGTLSGSRQA